MTYQWKKIIRHGACGLAVLCSLVILASAGFVPQNNPSLDVAGTWKSISHPEVAPMTLTSDGRASAGPLQGTYTLRGDQIRIVLQFPDNTTSKFELNGKVKGSSLLMERKDGDVTVFTRAGSQNVSSPQARDASVARPLTNPATQPPARSRSRYVTVNNVRIGDDTLRAIERQFQFHIPDGDYWYDKICGAWGKMGGPTLGFTWQGLNLGGRLPANASNGRTRVFVNGRELHYLDVLALQKLGPVYPGRYWLDAQGYVGYEGGPAFANLLQLSQQAGGQRRGGRKGSILSGMYDSGIGAVNGGGFISGDSSATWGR